MGGTKATLSFTPWRFCLFVAKRSSCPQWLPWYRCPSFCQTGILFKRASTQDVSSTGAQHIQIIWTKKRPDPMKSICQVVGIIVQDRAQAARVQKDPSVWIWGPKPWMWTAIVWHTPTVGKAGCTAGPVRANKALNARIFSTGTVKFLLRQEMAGSRTGSVHFFKKPSSIGYLWAKGLGGVIYSGWGHWPHNTDYKSKCTGKCFTGIRIFKDSSLVTFSKLNIGCSSFTYLHTVSELETVSWSSKEMFVDWSFSETFQKSIQNWMQHRPHSEAQGVVSYGLLVSFWK